MKTITTLKEALEKIKQLKSTYYFKRESEHVSIPDSVGRELSENIVADYMSPAFDIAAMDGFAIHSEDVYPLKIKGSVDAMLKIEEAEVKKDLLYGKNLMKWENVFKTGSDYRAGDRIFEKNHRIMPQSAAPLYSLGVEKVPVYKKIRAGIISTGTEIFNGMIRNTSSVLIQGFMKEMGCESIFAGAVPDDYNKTKKMLRYRKKTLSTCNNKQGYWKR